MASKLEVGGLGVGTAPDPMSSSTSAVHIKGTNAECKAETSASTGWAFSSYKSPEGSWTVGIDDDDDFRISNNSSLKTDTRLTIDSAGKIIVASMPTSSAGLATGTLWNDSGTVKIA
jgi:hypothetical protein